MLGALLFQAAFFATFSPAMKCDRYNKFLSLAFDSICASLKIPLGCIYSWVKHFSHKFATFDTFMVASWLGVYERWEEVCEYRFYHVVHLPFFSVLFPIFQMSGWSETRDSDCKLLGYLMGKFGSQSKPLGHRIELKN